MGEKFLADKEKWFSNRQDKLHERLFKSPDLLTATADRREVVYRFKSRRLDLEPGDPLLFVDDGRQHLSVFKGMHRVGEIEASGTADLRRLFAEFPALGKAIAAILCEKQDWAGFYSAMIAH